MEHRWYPSEIYGIYSRAICGDLGPTDRRTTASVSRNQESSPQQLNKACILSWCGPFRAPLGNQCLHVRIPRSLWDGGVYRRGGQLSLANQCAKSFCGQATSEVNITNWVGRLVSRLRTRDWRRVATVEKLEHCNAFEVHHPLVLVRE